MAEYKYGAYGELEATAAQSAAQTGTAPVYVGLFPINLVRGYAAAGLTGKPVKLNNLVHAQKTVGYSSDWATFTGCEAIAAHFDNTKGNIGPIYVINVLDPAVNRKQQITAVSLAFSAGRATIDSSKIILDTLKLVKKAAEDEDPAEYYVEGEDYVVDYNFTTSKVVISSVDSDNPITGTVGAEFYEIDATAITSTDIIGGVTASGVYSGLGCLKLMFPELGVVPNLIACPGWSHIPAVYNAMITAAQKINGHWYSFVLADIPLTDSEGAAIDTIAKAIAWKAANGYISEFSKVYWPQGADNTGRVFHLSTMAAVELMRADQSHNEVPMETCGNKTVPLIKQYLGASYNGNGFDKEASLELTQNGISTLISWSGVVLWGDHTAAYKYGTDVDPRSIFDVSIRMIEHIINGFQTRHLSDIDEPMSLAKKDEIVNEEQEILDSYAAMGALLGEPTILFLENENSTTDLMNGDFKWSIPVTPTPPLKSATAGVSYTDDGFESYFEEV